MRNICVITGSRAEYGLLYWLLKEIQNDSKLNLQIIVTGMHLSSEFGSTWQQIEADGFQINRKIEMLLSSDTAVGITKSVGLGMIGFSEAFLELEPDITVVLGDRFEIFSAAGAAMLANLPIAHLHGGELTEGAYDDAIRHSITKMAQFHFTAAEEYRKRVIQLGEAPDRVFNVGGLGIDNIKKMKLLSKKQFEEDIEFLLKDKNVLVTFHPVTREKNTAAHQMTELLNALNILKDTGIIFTNPNADTGGRIISQLIKKFVKANPERSIFFNNMGQLKYLSALKYVDAVVGNSSSGLIEAPSFKIGTLNIGDRQKGRITADSVINCNPDKTSILNSIEVLFSTKFKEKLRTVENPYGNGGASEMIKDILKRVNLDGAAKKIFFDLPHSCSSNRRAVQ